MTKNLKTKTILEWLEKLPDGYREKAIRQAKNGEFYSDSLRGAILSFNDWEETQEGFDFWRQTFLSISEGLELPPIPETKEECLPKKYQDFVNTAKELCEAHAELSKVRDVVLDYFPEYGDRFDGLGDILKEIFEEQEKQKK